MFLDQSIRGKTSQSFTSSDALDKVYSFLHDIEKLNAPVEYEFELGIKAIHKLTRELNLRHFGHHFFHTVIPKKIIWLRQKDKEKCFGVWYATEIFSVTRYFS